MMFKITYCRKNSSEQHGCTIFELNVEKLHTDCELLAIIPDKITIVHMSVPLALRTEIILLFILSFL